VGGCQVYAGKPCAGPRWVFMGFLPICWTIIKRDVLAALTAVFLDRGQNFGDVNGALIALLPKKDGAVELRDFRPISLVHSFAKLLAKILALRLALRRLSSWTRIRALSSAAAAYTTILCLFISPRDRCSGPKPLPCS
jgi:hypothetical protein